ncbi:unnamed protein product [Pedinophyceae sp. YPF-701]|nr:unnamed protein product [Pedinophyceae sp. YPF-701]
MRFDLLVPEDVKEFVSERLVPEYGPMIAGGLFGAGWWFWVDAVCSVDSKIPFPQWLPGFAATIAIVMINMMSRDEYEYDEGTECRAKSWLFISYIVSFGAVVSSVVVLIEGYAKNPDATSLWPGVAGIFQTVLILASGLVFFTTRARSRGDAPMSL